jgi:V8-like Glu-specific endopeptidase
MTHPYLPAEIWDSVLPICNDRGAVIGTGAVVAPHHVLTALHVVDAELAPRIADQFAIAAIVSLRWWQFGSARQLARNSYHRTVILSGEDDRAVDLALLGVPELCAPAVPVRGGPMRRAELVTVLGYPGARRTASHGPVTSTDDADFVAHMALGPGISGAPAIDHHGRLAGLITMDNATAGAIAIGPAVVTAFLARASRQLRTRDTQPRHLFETRR